MTFDQRYSDSEYVYGTSPNDFLSEVAPTLPRGRVLCLGEGEGRNAVFLAKGGWQVVALDISEVGLRKARELAAQNGVSIETVAADLNDFLWPESEYEAVISIWCHVPSALRARVHEGARRALKSGGAFVLEAYSPAQLAFDTGGPRDADMLVEVAELERQFAGFQMEVARELQREVVEGKYHTGRAAVTQFVARKP